MKLKNPMLVVTDLARTRAFYREVLGLRVIMDFGANITLTGGLSFQTKESWAEFIGRPGEQITFGGNNAEVYFEEEAFDGFLQKLEGIAGVEYVHPVVEHSWGQRVVRIYDPDRHIIEIAEPLKTVAQRFQAGGMTPEQIAVRMDVPAKLVAGLLR